MLRETNFFTNSSHVFSKNHLWYANLDKVKNSDTWCPFCPWKREELCKNVVTKLLGSPSDIRRPDFLKTPDHPLGLELDIYYPQYGFAIEVQGIQHERFHAFFHKDQEVFKKQFARDQIFLGKSNGIIYQCRHIASCLRTL